VAKSAKRTIDFDKAREAAQTDARGPTPERLWKSADAFDIGGDSQGGVRTYIFADSPLGRMFKGKRIDPIEFTALQRYKHHWYHGGLEVSMGSVDLNRVFASDPSGMSGMAKSERQAHHRQQYRAAKAEFEKAVPPFHSKYNRDTYGHKMGIVVDNVICAEWPLHIAGHLIGYESPYRARAAATEIITDAGYRLARLWGIG